MKLPWNGSRQSQKILKFELKNLEKEIYKYELRIVYTPWLVYKVISLRKEGNSEGKTRSSPRKTREL